MLNIEIVEEQVDQTWTIEQIARKFPPPSWEEVFQESMPEIEDISKILEKDELENGMFYPLKKNIFNALNYTQLNNVKVVILGQDPYHQLVNIRGKSVPRATGMSFSVDKDDKIPNSLTNIYKELQNCIPGFVAPDHGDLSEWASRGVLLLNTCLTVRPNKAGSHGDIWLGFVKKIFNKIAQVNPTCIYLLWGSKAKNLSPLLGEKTVKLDAAHPSGLSASRGFYGCKHFAQVNTILKHQKKTGINWNIRKKNLVTSAPITITDESLIINRNLVPITNSIISQSNIYKSDISPPQYVNYLTTMNNNRLQTNMISAKDEEQLNNSSKQDTNYLSIINSIPIITLPTII